MPENTQPAFDFNDAPPILERCKRCRFTDEINADGYCLLCSQIVKFDEESR